MTKIKNERILNYIEQANSFWLNVCCGVHLQRTKSATLIGGMRRNFMIVVFYTQLPTHFKNIEFVLKFFAKTKCFKICHIFGKRKHTYLDFFVFHFILLYFFPNVCSGLCRHRPGAFIREKIK